MKNLLWNFLLVFCTICLFTACSDDENEETNCEASPVTGMIDGQTFNFGTGTAITDSSSGELFITPMTKEKLLLIHVILMTSL